MRTLLLTHSGRAGTSLNMNANEVIANRAIEILGGQKGDYFYSQPLTTMELRTVHQ